MATLKTSNPEIWEIYRKVCSYSDGGSKHQRLKPETIEELRAVMPQLRQYAKNEKHNPLRTMKSVIRMFDENFK